MDAYTVELHWPRDMFPRLHSHIRSCRRSCQHGELRSLHFMHYCKGLWKFIFPPPHLAHISIPQPIINVFVVRKLNQSLPYWMPLYMLAGYRTSSTWSFYYAVLHCYTQNSVSVYIAPCSYHSKILYSLASLTQTV